MPSVEDSKYGMDDPPGCLLPPKVFEEDPTPLGTSTSTGALDSQQEIASVQSSAGVGSTSMLLATPDTSPPHSIPLPAKPSSSSRRKAAAAATTGNAALAHSSSSLLPLDRLPTLGSCVIAAATYSDPLDGSTGSDDAPSSAGAYVLESKLKIDFGDLYFHELIGKGSFKTVYRGRWNNTNVAIVSMRRGGMVTEARVLQRMSKHPNLVQFYRWTTDDRGNEYMVIELVPLGSLDQVLLSHGASLRGRVKMMMCEQICSAMCELQEESVLHRDLAARNILCQCMDPVHIKVADFGLARAGAGLENIESVPVRWCAPEVLARGEWSQKSEVWAYGVTLWEIWSNGADPYARKSNEEVIRSVLLGDRLSRPARCPQDLFRLMQQCWHHNPAERPTFAAMSQQYKRWRDDFQAAKSLKPSKSASGRALLPSDTAMGSMLRAQMAAATAAKDGGAASGGGGVLKRQPSHPLSPLQQTLSPHQAQHLRGMCTVPGCSFPFVHSHRHSLHLPAPHSPSLDACGSATGSSAPALPSSEPATRGVSAGSTDNDDEAEVRGRPSFRRGFTSSCTEASPADVHYAFSACLTSPVPGAGGPERASNCSRDSGCPLPRCSQNGGAGAGLRFYPATANTTDSFGSRGTMSLDLHRRYSSGLLFNGAASETLHMSFDVEPNIDPALSCSTLHSAIQIHHTLQGHGSSGGVGGTSGGGTGAGFTGGGGTGGATTPPLSPCLLQPAPSGASSQNLAHTSLCWGTEAAGAGASSGYRTSSERYRSLLEERDGVRSFESAEFFLSAQRNAAGMGSGRPPTIPSGGCLVSGGALSGGAVSGGGGSTSHSGTIATLDVLWPPTPGSAVATLTAASTPGSPLSSANAGAGGRRSVPDCPLRHPNGHLAPGVAPVVPSHASGGFAQRAGAVSRASPNPAYVDIHSVFRVQK